MNKWFTDYITKIYTRFTLWLMKGTNATVLFTEDNRYIVLMTEEEFKEWKEFTDNLFIVYENEEQLKMDFPNAKQKV